MFGFIYETTNTLNGKRYVGLCTHENPIKTEGKLYLGSGTIIKNAVKRYGRKMFTRCIVEVCNSEQELLQAEIKWISELNPEYNIESGGNAGISSRMKDYWTSMTAEERKQSRNWAKHDMSGENNPMYGRSTSALVKNVWDNRSESERANIGSKVSASRKALGLAKGKNNPMYGKSAIRDKNLKWYTNGIEDKYITEGTQLEGWTRGRSKLRKQR
jgi:group I intron endonuclease